MGRVLRYSPLFFALNRYRWSAGKLKQPCTPAFGDSPATQIEYIRLVMPYYIYVEEKPKYPDREADMKVYFILSILALTFTAITYDMITTRPTRKKKDMTTYPTGWDVYWELRTFPNTFTITEAHEAMVTAGYSEFCGYKREQLRHLEVKTSFELPCECRQCLHGITDNHRPPLTLAPIVNPV